MGRPTPGELPMTTQLATRRASGLGGLLSILVIAVAASNVPAVAQERPADAAGKKDKGSQNSTPLLVLTGAAGGKAQQFHGLAFSPDGKLIASADQDGAIRIWDTLTGKEVRAIQADTKRIWSVAFSPDGKLLASSGWDKTVRVWDTATGRQTLLLNGHTAHAFCVAFSPDGKHLASGSDDTSVRIWETESGKLVRTLAGHRKGVFSLQYSPDGNRLATAGLDGRIKIWDTASGKETLACLEDCPVLGVAFSPDGRRIASAACLENSGVKTWDVTTGRELLNLICQDSVAFSPDGRHIASALHLLSLNKITGAKVIGAELKVWDATTGHEVLVFKDNGAISNVAFSPDGKRLASVSPAAVKIWDIGNLASKKIDK
jgi:WD40 repeat protein